jgi:hypothetical protein
VVESTASSWTKDPSTLDMMFLDLNLIIYLSLMWGGIFISFIFFPSIFPSGFFSFPLKKLPSEGEAITVRLMSEGESTFHFGLLLTSLISHEVWNPGCWLIVSKYCGQFSILFFAIFFKKLVHTDLQKLEVSSLAIPH